ncbi:MAG TPA: VOC family protein [Flavisolibacter sp.]|jgi:predicted 3-demethylubiquinone-9 3-methyltransferase (glyoxalase superfamily)|nr:VOC family protein [Flavisolibacter sp.]
MKQQIYPCLWLNGNAKEAAAFYCSVFPNSSITDDTPMVVTFTSAGQKFMLLNGGPEFKPNPSLSFFVVCETKEEVDAAWRKLADDGNVLMPLDAYPWSSRYGWVQDRFGFSWQLSYGKLEDVGQKFTPTLMFTGDNAGKAEEAIQFYTSVFTPSSVTGILRYGANEGDTEGRVKHAQFTLNGSVLMAMDSSFAHGFSFNEAVSLVVECGNQQEIDFFWNALTEGGAESMCGWLKDRYGLSWQIVPEVLKDLMNDPEKAPKVVEAFLKMKKFDIAALENAAAVAV